MRQCWCCGANALDQLFPEITNRLILVCNTCGLVQKHDLEGEAVISAPFYKLRSEEESERYFRTRKVYSTTIHLNYIKNILAQVRLPEVGAALDVGCAEGLFSHVFAHEFPQWRVYGVDPDEGAIQYGCSHYKNVNLSHGLIETYHCDEKFDLITDFGAIYRCRRPYEILEKYHSMLNGDGLIAISLGAALDNLSDANSQRWPDSLAAALPQGDNTLRSLFTKPLFEAFLKRLFDPIACVTVQTYPYIKETNVFIARKREQVREFNRDAASYEYNAKLVSQYAYDVTRRRLHSLKDTGIQEIAVVGITPEMNCLVQAAREVGIVVKYVIDDLIYQRKEQQVVNLPIVDFSEMFTNPVDAVVIADYERHEDIFRALRHFLKIDRKYKILSGFYPRQEIPVVGSKENGLQLNVAFCLESIYER